MKQDFHDCLGSSVNSSLLCPVDLLHTEHFKIKRKRETKKDLYDNSLPYDHSTCSVSDIVVCVKIVCVKKIV